MTTVNILYLGDDQQAVTALVSANRPVTVCVVSNTDDALARLTDTSFDGLLLDPSYDDADTLLEAVDDRCLNVTVIFEAESVKEVPPLPATADEPTVTGATVDVDAVVEAVGTPDETDTIGEQPSSPLPSVDLVSGLPDDDLVEERAFIDTVLNGLVDILFVADTDGNLLRWNERLNDVTGYTDAEIARMEPDDFLVADGVTTIRSRLAELETGRDLTVDVYAQSKDGTETPYEITASLVEGDSGEYICGVGRDITERRETERRLDEAVAELERSNTELEQFAYVASHDMKEPLRMVSSYLELLERRYGDELDEDAHEFIGFAVEGADRMREMINGLLAYSRVGRQTKDFGRVDVNDILSTVRSNLRIAIEESDAVIHTDDLPAVLGDPGQLTQLFQNLVANAIKYTDEGQPEIEISARREGDEWVFTVADNGIGIPPEQREEIFDIFSGESGHGGSGIGLAICDKIVGHHGGRIWVESEVGDGSTFHFTIPEHEESLDLTAEASLSDAA